MKHLMTLLALVVAVTAGAQTLWPWNPDSDSDNVIGVEDLMSVLSVFGTEFYIELDAPSTSPYTLAMVKTEHIGTKITCLGECLSIGGRLPSEADMAVFGPLIPFDHYRVTNSSTGSLQNYLYGDNDSWVQQAYWSDSDTTYLYPFHGGNGNYWYNGGGPYADGYWKGHNGSSNEETLYKCYCVGLVDNALSE